MRPENPRKLRESSAKALTSWDGPSPFDREWQCPLWSGARGVWLYPLRSGGRSWGPAVPTEIWRSRLKPGSAHWDLARGWGWSGGRGGEGGGGGRGDGRHAALIKLRDFRMAGGEQMFQYVFAREHREFFQDFPRKPAKVYFRHVDAAKEKRHIPKGSRKRWRKGRQNRTQSIGYSATAHMYFYIYAHIYTVLLSLLLLLFLYTVYYIYRYAYAVSRIFGSPMDMSFSDSKKNHLQ